MPKLVDHGARRADLVHALWEVVRTRGIQAVSVRSVAAAAGTSPSALRHYFATQDELLAFALTAVVDRVRARIEPGLTGLAGRRGARVIAEQFLPLDEERRAEIAVYLAFIGRSPGSPELRRIRDETDELALSAVRLAVRLLADAGALGAGRDPEAEAVRLYGLLDGLAMHASLMPDRYPAADLGTLLDTHLADLGQPVTGASASRPAAPERV